jgi:hypothetical protein
VAAPGRFRENKLGLTLCFVPGGTILRWSIKGKKSDIRAVSLAKVD